MKAKGHLAYDRPQPWGQAAADLMHVEISGQWKKRFGSFSLYLQYLANEKKKTKSSFWRLRRAGRYYNELQEKLAKAGTEFPELQDPTVKATPESLELLAKISRVAPLELLEDLEPRTMAGGVTRGALREIWETYRPVLLGETARGRKVAPRFDEGNQMMQSALAEANTLAPIVQDAPNWIGVDGAVYACRVVHISNNEALKHVYRPAAPDMVVVLARNENSPLELHGVKVGFTVKDNEMLRHYRRDSRDSGVDFLWFASSKPLIKIELVKLPEGVGVLHITPGTPGKVRVIHEAQATSGTSRRREELLRALLCEATRNKIP